MTATALVYLTSLHPDRERAAARGGPSGEMFMSGSLLTGLSDLGFRVSQPGTLRHFLQLRVSQILRLREPDIFFLDPWSLALARRYKALSRKHASRTFVLEWFGSTEAAIPSTTGLTPQNYLVPYPYPNLGNRFLGFILRSQSGAFFANEAELRSEFQHSLERTRSFGVVWGKEPRYFGPRERALIQTLATRLPMHLTAEWGTAEPLTGDGIVNHGHMESADWRSLLRGAKFVLGLGDPILGPTALEALAAGAILLNPSFAPPRPVEGNAGVLFDSQHPFSAGIGPPYVLSIDLSQTERVVRTVEDLMAREPTDMARSFPPALADFTRAAYVSRLALIVPRPKP